MMRAAFLCLLLTGCACAPRVIEKPVEVQVPVPVPCKTPDVPVPAWPLDAMKATDTDFTFYQAALAEIALRKGYEARLRAALAICQE